MARVTLMSSLLAFTGGEGVLEVDAANVHQLLRRLGERFPRPRPHLDDSLAVAIDGEIHQDDWFARLEPDSEGASHAANWRGLKDGVPAPVPGAPAILEAAYEVSHLIEYIPMVKSYI